MSSLYSTCPQVRHTSINSCNFLAPGLAIIICRQVYLFDMEISFEKKVGSHFLIPDKYLVGFMGQKKGRSGRNCGSPRPRPEGQ